MNHRFENALVLSGGSIKGAFQAGAIAEVLAKGFEPDAIYGISVGSLNGAFLADRAGRAAMQGKSPDWPAIGRELLDFWTLEIRSSESIAKKRGLLRTAAAILFKKWAGLTDTTPLRALVEREVTLEHIVHAPVYFACGATNLNTGQIFYSDAKNSAHHLLDFIVASASIPFFMPQEIIRRKVGSKIYESAYVDGGVRDSSPLGYAIDKGATRVMSIYCHPENLDVKADLAHRQFMCYTERIMDIIGNENITNDHRTGFLINELIRSGAGDRPDSPLKGMREIKGLKYTIRPESEISYEIDDINPALVAEMIALGRKSAANYFGKIAGDPNENPMLGGMKVA